MPRRCGLALRLLCLAAAWPAARGESESVLAIANKLKMFRDAGVSVFEGTAAHMRSAGALDSANKVAKWSDDWLSVLGVNKGITGLAKDFVFNYLGRSAYHDKNGRLIDYIKELAAAFPEAGSEVEAVKVMALQAAVLRVCREGKRLFEEDGSLHTMLSELQDITQSPDNLLHFKEALKSSSASKELFEYLAGSAPRTEL